MIRISNFHSRIIGRHHTRVQSSSLLSTQATKNKDAPTTTSKEQQPKRGIPYNQLTLGIPKEIFPLEKRVAATPEVGALYKT